MYTAGLDESRAREAEVGVIGFVVSSGATSNACCVSGATPSVFAEFHPVDCDLGLGGEANDSCKLKCLNRPLGSASDSFNGVGSRLRRMDTFDAWAKSYEPREPVRAEGSRLSTEKEGHIRVGITESSTPRAFFEVGVAWAGRASARISSGAPLAGMLLPATASALSLAIVASKKVCGALCRGVSNDQRRCTWA